MSDWIRLVVKFKGVCAECGKEILVGEHAFWLKGSKAIKHAKCETQSSEKKEEKPKVQELDCFVCGRPSERYEADYDNQAVLQAWLCSRCLDDTQAYANYRQAFVEKARNVQKLKFE